MKSISYTSQDLSSVIKYKRVFQFDGIHHLSMHVWMLGYWELSAGMINYGGTCTYLLPTHGFHIASKKGKSLFSNKTAFSRYYKDFNKFIHEFKAYYIKRIKCNEKLTQSDVKGFFEQCSKIFRFFYKTEFFTVDPAYEQLKNDKAALKRFLQNYRLKEIGRVELINKLYYGKDSYINVLMHKLSAMFLIPADELTEYNVHEILGLFDGKHVKKNVIKDRATASILTSNSANGEINCTTGLKAKRIAKKYYSIESKLEISCCKLNMLNGIVASPGFYKGKVKIIVSNLKYPEKMYSEMKRMKVGDILVAETTEPALMPACLKAGAIVTNQGGILSHAAIISREQKIPCIIDTKIATKVFKDGDVVEVDAIKGIVKKIR